MYGRDSILDRIMTGLVHILLSVGAFLVLAMTGIGVYVVIKLLVTWIGG